MSSLVGLWAVLFTLLGTSLTISLAGPGGVTVTPEIVSRSVPAHSGSWLASFFVKNTSTLTKTYNLACGGVAACSVSPTSVTLAAGAQIDVDVSYTTGNLDPTGSLTLSTSGGGIGSGTMTLDIGPSMVLMTGPGPDASGTQTVHRTRPVLRADFVLPSGEATDTNTIKIWWRGKTDSTLSLRRNAAMLEWEVPSDLALAPGDTATFKVHHCLVSGPCTDESRVVQLLADQKPVIDFTAMPFEGSGGGFSAPFGPGLAVSGAELTTGIATPPYVSRGVARSAALVYSTATSYPRALITTDIQLPWPTSGTYDLTATLWLGGVRQDSVKILNATCGVGGTKRCRVVLQSIPDASLISGGVARRWYSVEVRATSGGTSNSATDSVEAVVVDRRDSPYGSGWWPGAAMRLYGVGSDRVLVGAGGTALIYRGSGDSLYLPPSGSTTNLVKTASGWELRTRGTTAKVVFDATGRVVKGVDASGNRDSVVYSVTVPTRVTDLIDPTDRRISFYYGSATGKLDSLVALPGSGVSLRTRVLIDTATNQLRYDSLASAAARPIVANYKYLTYGTLKGTSQLQARYGRLGSDSVYVSYDTSLGHRPYRAILRRPMSSASDSIASTITYRAAELRGYHAYVLPDSVNVEVIDPRGNWTRSLVARDGQRGLTWDTLGVLSRDSLDGHGRVLWSEGKNADSSRVFVNYDSLGRVHRSFVRRTANDTLWLTRLTFDANDRVIKRLDPLGHADSMGYDGNGRLSYARDVAGGITRWYYRTDGLLDSVRAPGSNLARRFTYTSSWRNLERSFVAGDSLSAVTSFDGQGRNIGGMGKVRVRLNDNQVTWRWRQSLSWSDVAGRPDSTAVYQTAECSSPCSTPGTFTRIRTTYVVYDSVGQVKQTRDSATSVSVIAYVRDRLGRVLEAQRNGSQGDSLIYDLAGNVVTTVTRRGHSITASYDSRNRASSTVVPGYGTIQRSFGGPQDQLTALTVSGYGDSIGGVKPDRKWTYDQRGRLLADTLWTGTQARATTYAYDGYDRLIRTIDPRDTTRVSYDAGLGRLSGVRTPFNDSLQFSWDTAGRPVQSQVIHLPSGGRNLTQEWSFTGAGSLEAVGATLPASGGLSGYDAGTWADYGDYADGNQDLTLLPVWTRQDGDGTALHTEKDSLRYDGMERLTRWKGMTDGVMVATDRFTYDASGNLGLDGETRTYAAGTNRLTWRVATGSYYTYSYDAAGNLATVGDTSWAGVHNCRWEYGYDALDRLTSVRVQGKVGGQQVLARYAYDVLGNRIARRVYTTVSDCSSATPTYVRYGVQGGHVLFETDSAGATITRQYVWGLGVDDLVALRIGTDTAQTYYAVKDQLGSIRAWVNKAGTWQWGGRYRPYGVQAESRGTSPDQPYAWTGREYDPETGFYFLRARYYDPTIGRFTQEDPIGEAGGSNLYAYVEGQPLEQTDPSGMIPIGAGQDWRNTQHRYPVMGEDIGFPNTWDGWYGLTSWLFPSKFEDAYLDGKFIGRRPGWSATGGNSKEIVFVGASDAEIDLFYNLAMGSNRFLEAYARLTASGATVTLEYFDGGMFQASGVGFGNTQLTDKNGVAITSSSFNASDLADIHVYLSRGDYNDPAAVRDAVQRTGVQPSPIRVLAHEIGHAFQALSGYQYDETFARRFSSAVFRQFWGYRYRNGRL